MKNKVKKTKEDFTQGIEKIKKLIYPENVKIGKNEINCDKVYAEDIEYIKNNEKIKLGKMLIYKETEETELEKNFKKFLNEQVYPTTKKGIVSTSVAPKKNLLVLNENIKKSVMNSKVVHDNKLLSSPSIYRGYRTVTLLYIWSESAGAKNVTVFQNEENLKKETPTKKKKLSKIFNEDFLENDDILLDDFLIDLEEIDDPNVENVVVSNEKEDFSFKKRAKRLSDRVNFCNAALDTEFDYYIYNNKVCRFLLSTQISLAFKNERYHVFITNYSFNDVQLGRYLGYIFHYFFTQKIFLNPKGIKRKYKELIETYETKKGKIKHRRKLEWQKYVCNMFLSFHNSRCDLTCFSDCLANKVTNKFIENGSTLSTATPISIDGNYGYRGDRLGQQFIFNIQLRDNMNYLVGKKSLDSYSDKTSYGKITDNNFDKTNMLYHMINDTSDFVRYGLSDSATTLDFPLKFFKTTELPITIGSCSVSDFCEKFCQENHIKSRDEFYFVYSGKVRKPHPIKKEFIWDYKDFSVKDTHEQFKNAFFGGLNQCYTRGLVKEFTIDFDLLSAYASIMSMTPMIDYDKEFTTLINPSLKDCENLITKFMNLSCATIDYDLNKSTDKAVNHICLYAQKAVGSLSLVTRGTSVKTTGPGLYVGLKLGVITKVHRLDIVPEKEGVFPFRGYLQEKIDNRSLYDKHTLENELEKLLANSIYGKTGQGVSDTRSPKYENGVKHTEKVPRCKISNDIYCSTITETCRMILLLVMQEICRQGYKVYSVTTDGFITNYPEELINSVLDTPLTKDIHETLKNIRLLLTHNKSGNYFEAKHYNYHGFINFATRTNIGLDESGVLARGGSNYKDDRTIVFYIIYNDYILVETYGKATNLNDMINKNKDYRIVDIPKKSSFDYDHKRKIKVDTIEEQDLSGIVVETPNGLVKFKDGTKMVAFETEPYETIEEFANDKKHTRDYIVNNVEIITDKLDKTIQFARTRNTSLKNLDTNKVLKSLFYILYDRTLIDDKYFENYDIKHELEKVQDKIKSMKHTQSVSMINAIFNFNIEYDAYRQMVSRFKRKIDKYDYITNEICVPCVQQIIEYMQK